MRVLHLIADLQLGGAERMLARLIPILREREIDAAVGLFGLGGPIADELEARNVPLFAWEFPRGLLFPARHRCWRSFLTQHPCQIVQGWMVHGNLWASLIGGRNRLPVVWSVRQSYTYSTYDPMRTTVLNWVARGFASNPDRIIFNSTSGRDLITRSFGYPAAKSTVIPNGVDVTEYAPSAKDASVLRAELGIDAHVPLLGMVARFHPIKGFDIFCEAAALIQRARPDTRFLLCGKSVDDKNDSLRDMLDRTGMRGRILLGGHRFDIPRVLAALDILVSCSYSEAFSNTIVEAMSCSVPCVVTDTGDSAALVGNTGKVVAIGSAGAAAEACLDLLALSPTDRNELGRAARARIVANFSLGTAADRFAAEYRALVATS